MNREKRDKIPSMQVSFIDAICIQLYEASQSTENDCFLMTVIATYYYIIYKFLPALSNTEKYFLN